MTSPQTVMPDVIVRPLTSGEVALARSVFGTALNTSTVRIHNRPYFPFQGRGIAMTPNGEVWFRPDDYLPDFSRAPSDRTWLIHELTHAWQYQHGRSIILRGMYEQVTRFIRDSYHYGKLDREKTFDKYLNEQQAAIVADYYRLLNGLKPQDGTGDVDDYRTVIPFAPKRFYWSAPRSK